MCNMRNRFSKWPIFETDYACWYFSRIFIYAQSVLNIRNIENRLRMLHIAVIRFIKNFLQIDEEYTFKQTVDNNFIKVSLQYSTGYIYWKSISKLINGKCEFRFIFDNGKVVDTRFCNCYYYIIKEHLSVILIPFLFALRFQVINV